MPELKMMCNENVVIGNAYIRLDRINSDGTATLEIKMMDADSSESEIDRLLDRIGELDHRLYLKEIECNKQDRDIRQLTEVLRKRDKDAESEVKSHYNQHGYPAGLNGKDLSNVG